MAGHTADTTYLITVSTITITTVSRIITEEETLLPDIEIPIPDGVLMLEALEILETPDILPIEIQEFKVVTVTVQEFKEDIVIMITQECTQDLAVERNLRDHIIPVEALETVLLLINVHQEVTIAHTELPVLLEVIVLLPDLVL